MGIYATTTAISSLLADFDSLTSNQITLLGKCITHAENEINKFLSKRYDITVWNTTTSIPPLVTSLAETYAEGFYWYRASRGGKETLARGKTLMDMVMTNLKDLASYRANLVDSSGNLIAEKNASLGVLGDTDSYFPTFAEDDSLDWQVDSTKLSDIETSRG